jgi:prolyl 4-hydroxylase
MSALVHFSPELSAWLTRNLDRGCPPAQLVETMVGQRMEGKVASAIVEAFLGARREGRPAPVSSVTIEEDGLTFVREPPRLRSGALVGTSDRAVRVQARAESVGLTVLGDLLDDEECAGLIERARPRLQASTVVDPDSGHDVVAAHRTSLGMFFRLGEDDLIARLDRRFSEVMNLPLAHGEGFQVLHYPVGTGSTEHLDYLIPSNPSNLASIARSGQRVSTLVAYLNDVEGGGETVFPRIGWSVPPQRGHGVYFEYCNSLGQVDPLSLHAGSPVTRGEKWVLTKWMRQRPFVSAGQAALRVAR